jgi:hypothetical protein
MMNAKAANLGRFKGATQELDFDEQQTAHDAFMYSA